jgi:hypothetical protein
MMLHIFSSKRGFLLSSSISVGSIALSAIPQKYKVLGSIGLLVRKPELARDYNLRDKSSHCLCLLAFRLVVFSIIISSDAC